MKNKSKILIGIVCVLLITIGATMFSTVSSLKGSVGASSKCPNETVLIYSLENSSSYELGSLELEDIHDALKADKEENSNCYYWFYVEETGSEDSYEFACSEDFLTLEDDGVHCQAGKALFQIEDLDLFQVDASGGGVSMTTQLQGDYNAMIINHSTVYLDLIIKRAPVSRLDIDGVN